MNEFGERKQNVGCIIVQTMRALVLVIYFISYKYTPFNLLAWLLIMSDRVLYFFITQTFRFIEYNIYQSFQ